MRLSFLKTRFILYLLLLTIIGAFLFNFLLTRQSEIMYNYFIEKPAAYNEERAKRLAGAIHSSFWQEISDPSIENIRSFIVKYNDIPFLSVNFIYKNDKGELASVVGRAAEKDILEAEHVYPIKYGRREIGTLVIYDISKEYGKGLTEYTHMLFLTRVFFSILLFMLFFLLLYREYSAKIEEEKRQAEYRAVHDGLTGLYTHKYFKERLDMEVTRSERSSQPLSLILCDVDNFKKFNDTYGHLAGDEVLKAVSRIISDNIRSIDLVARYGGEEFAILLLETGAAGDISDPYIRTKQLTAEALATAKRIKDKIERARIKMGVVEVSVTISMGLALYGGQPEYKPEYIISEADLALYESKNRGRNRITLYLSETKEFVEYS